MTSAAGCWHGDDENPAFQDAKRRDHYNAAMQRREFLTSVTVAGLSVPFTRADGIAQSQTRVQRKGRIKQALFRQVFGNPNMAFDEQCRIAADLGCVGFDLIGPQDWPTLKKYGLVPTMAGAGPVTFPDGVIHKEMHAELEPKMKAYIDQCVEGGCSKIITVGGQRKGMSYAEGRRQRRGVLQPHQIVCGEQARRRSVWRT